MNADALADLANQPYFRLPLDPSAAFDAAEIAPVSLVASDGQVYRSVWTRGVDAVSAVFMRAGFQAEYVLDAGTNSLTDIVLTSPTRRYYVAPSAVSAPFAGAAGWSQVRCRNEAAAGLALFGERMTARIFNREEAFILFDGDPDFPIQPVIPYGLCAASTTFSVYNFAPHVVAGGGINSMVLGSINMSSNLFSSATFPNGWIEMAQRQPGSLASLSTSTRIDVSTGASVSGSHRFIGLPMTGMFVRVFQNGTLTCGAGTCQGNYGGGFPLRYRRSIQSN